MKKFFILILPLLIFAGSSPVYAKINPSLTLYADNDSIQSINFKFLLGQFKFCHQEGKTALGLSAFSTPIAKNISFTMQYGNLSSGGALSKLNNPLLSTSTSAFSSGYSKPAAITSYLPGNTSFSNPFRFFLQFGNTFNKKAWIKWTSNYLYCPEEDKNAFSLYLNKNLFQNKIKLSGQYTFGFFPYAENKISSWFTDELYYHDGTHFSSMYQISLDSKNFYTSFLQGIYETPFGIFSHIFRTDNKINTKNFTFIFSALYNPNFKENTIITSSDKTLANCFQSRFSLNYKYRTGNKRPVFVKNGLAAYLNLNLQDTEHNFKLCFGSQITNSLTSITFQSYMNGKIESSNPYSPEVLFESANLKVQNNWYFSDFTPGLSASVSFNPSSAYDSLTITSRYSVSLMYIKQAKIKGSASLSLTNKDGIYTSRKLTCSINSTFNIKKITVILKLTANMNLN